MQVMEKTAMQIAQCAAWLFRVFIELECYFTILAVAGVMPVAFTM